jgi:ankyrin repeat protein
MPKRTFVLPLLILGLCGACFGQNQSTDSKAIFDAVRSGDLQKVLAFLDKGIDINIRGEFNYTPLIAASRYNHIDIAQALCDGGADVNAAADYSYQAKEWRGFTPLLWAAEHCYVDRASLLIAKGADVERRGSGGDLPLIVAARSGCLPLAKIFISKGASVDAVDEESGDTALIEAVSGGYLDLAEYLIEEGADIGRRSQGGRSLFLLAAFRRHYAGVRYFHEKGFSINDGDRLGQTAMHAAANDSVESRYILAYLIEHDGNVSIKDATGTSPLMRASYNGANIAAGILIARGAAVNDEDNDRNTPLHYACELFGAPERNRKVIKREATLRLLIDKGAKINVQNRNGITPLMNAARYQVPLIVVETLLESGSIINTQDREGWTALMYAAEGNRTEVIKMLVAKGADLNLRNSKGETALTVAKRRKSSSQAYEILKSRGAKD